MLSGNNQDVSVVEDSDRPQGHFSGYATLLRFALVILVVILLARQIDFASLRLSFDRTLVWAAILFQIPMITGHLWYARRHAILVRKPPIPLLIAVEAIILSAALNIVTPGRIAELVKATYLRSRLGVPLAHGLSAVLIERLFDVVFVGAIAATGVAGMLNVGGTLVIALPIGGLTALFVLRPCATLLSKRLAGRHSPFARFIERQCRHIVTILKRDIIARAALLTAGSWLAHLAALALFFHLLPMRSLSLPEVTLVFGAIVLASAIPALPAGLGMFEAAVVYVLQSRGVGFNQALAFAIVLHVAELLPAAVLGPVIMLRRSMGVGQLSSDAIVAIKGMRRR
ncbi:flippase-like domain-containing protein [Bradyrhizobium sediminis]|uniref:Flippase-like domain-containing protein n=1 Tax=Bradyrhizobium sediminis TaxID=2840469 RepID=A0A975RPK4_9BRAD|nr:lysylphosphatidylglycerol synthase transmembrane domain-containing protein [Bradyrhizobium sediminis]QWG14878.1 flippase-like domain-containing protein [Bradyrhizobium sediminis]